MNDFQVLPLSRSIKLKAFDAGVEPLTDYLKKHAGQNQAKGTGRTFAQVNENSEAVGYYVASMAEVSFLSFPEEIRKRVPKYPIPAMRIGRLAIDVRFRGKGLGERLLMDALKRASGLYEQTGIFVVVVDARYEPAGEFYERYGFIRFLDRPGSLVLPIATIIKAFQ